MLIRQLYILCHSIRIGSYCAQTLMSKQTFIEQRVPLVEFKIDRLAVYATLNKTGDISDLRFTSSRVK